MERNLDNKGRWRKRTVGFRVSEEESQLIDNLVAISGLPKQEYILNRLLNRDVIVQGNPKVFKALKNQMLLIYEELKRIDTVTSDNEEMLITLCSVMQIMEGLAKSDDK